MGTETWGTGERGNSKLEKKRDITKRKLSEGNLTSVDCPVM